MEGRNRRVLELFTIRTTRGAQNPINTELYRCIECFSPNMVNLGRGAAAEDVVAVDNWVLEI